MYFVGVRKAWVLCSAIAVLASACAGTRPPEEDTPASHSVAAGETFEIRLPANPTTGYSWELGKPLDEKVVRLVSSRFEAVPSELVGQGGASIWKFEGVAPGRTTIRLIYLRPWERGVAPGRIATYSVDVL